MSSWFYFCIAFTFFLKVLSTTIKFGNLFLITYFENICKSDLPRQVCSPNMIWKCVYLHGDLHGNFRKCLAALLDSKNDREKYVKELGRDVT